jgi:hypothetical protein
MPPRDVHVGRVTLDVGQNQVVGAANVGLTVAGAVLRDLEVACEIELAYHHIHVLAPDALRSRLA